MRKSLAAVAAIALVSAGAVLAAPSASATTCNDGSYSSSSGRGTCSWHGGIDRSYGYDNNSSRGYSNYGYSNRGYSNNGYGNRGYSNYDYGNRSSSIYGYDDFGW